MYKKYTNLQVFTVHSSYVKQTFFKIELFLLYPAFDSFWCKGAR